MAGAGTQFKIAWAIVIEAGVNDALHLHTDLQDDTVVVAPGEYFWRNDHTAADLVLAFENALNTNTHGGVYVVSLASNGVLHITCTKIFTLRWNDAPTLLDKALFGFYGNSTAGGPPYVLDGFYQVGHCFIPEQPYIRDTEDVPCLDSSQSRSLDGHVRTLIHGSWFEREVEIDLLPPSKVWTADEDRLQEAFERAYAWLAAGGEFEFARDWVAHPEIYASYVVTDEDWRKRWPLTIPTQLVLLYTLRLPMQRVAV